MKSKFGRTQLFRTTPTWALWLFRITFLLTKIVVGYIASTNLLDPNLKYEVTLILTLVVDPLVFGVSKMFGIEGEEDAS